MSATPPEQPDWQRYLIATLKVLAIIVGVVILLFGVCVAFFAIAYR